MIVDESKLCPSLGRSVVLLLRHEGGVNEGGVNGDGVDAGGVGDGGRPRVRRAPCLLALDHQGGASGSFAASSAIGSSSPNLLSPSHMMFPVLARTGKQKRKTGAQGTCAQQHNKAVVTRADNERNTEQASENA